MLLGRVLVSIEVLDCIHEEIYIAMMELLEYLLGKEREKKARNNRASRFS